MVNAKPPIDLERFEADLQLLGLNLEMILLRWKEILSNEEYFFCYPACALLWNPPMIYPMGSIPLGALVTLYREGELLRSCPVCRTKAHVFGCGISPVSGVYAWWGYCSQCGRVHEDHPDGIFPSLWIPLRQMMFMFPNKPIIRRGERARFSWGKGTEGKDEPDTLVKPAVKGFDLPTVIRRLRQKEEQ